MANAENYVVWNDSANKIIIVFIASRRASSNKNEMFLFELLFILQCSWNIDSKIMDSMNTDGHAANICQWMIAVTKVLFM